MRTRVSWFEILNLQEEGKTTVNRSNIWLKLP